MPYEWNEKKNKSNIEKHFVDFEDAKKIFDDYNRIDAIDDRQDYGEVRYQSIGKTEGLILFVIWTKRQLKIRIISARPAKIIERRKYYEQQN